MRQEQLKERLGERFRELDVPLLVEWPDGRREAVVFVLEEQTTAGRFNSHRLAHYCLDITELLGTDRVVPVVIFLGRAGSAPRELHLGGERHTYLSFRYLACSLADLPAERYFDSDNLVCRLNLPNMSHTPAPAPGGLRAGPAGPVHPGNGPGSPGQVPGFHRHLHGPG